MSKSNRSKTLSKSPSSINSKNSSKRENRGKSASSIGSSLSSRGSSSSSRGSSSSSINTITTLDLDSDSPNKKKTHNSAKSLKSDKRSHSHSQKNKTQRSPPRQQNVKTTQHIPPLRPTKNHWFSNPTASVEKQSSAKSQTKANQNRAAQIITNFIDKRLAEKRLAEKRSIFLGSICSDSGACIAFGEETYRIRRHFKGYDPRYLYDAKIIGNGRHGMVNELTYKRESYVANSVLKMSKSNRSHNLLYEGMVGFFLNNFVKTLPNFVETYAIYKLNTQKIDIEKPILWITKKWFENSTRVATKSDEVNDEIIKTACENPSSIAILVQHLKGAQTLRTMLHHSISFWNYELLYVLFQVYFSLNMILDQFTHYDLHDENVMIFSPVKGQYITYVYHFKTDYIEFKSNYMVKIIDYGTGYFNTKTKGKFTDSTAFKDILCKVHECNLEKNPEAKKTPEDKKDPEAKKTPEAKKKQTEDKKKPLPLCGNTKGFSWLNVYFNDKTDDEFQTKHLADVYLSSTRNNQSQDLRLLSIIQKLAQTIQKRQVTTSLSCLRQLPKVTFTSGYGTAEIEESGLGSNQINNVKDAFKVLSKLLLKIPNTKSVQTHLTDLQTNLTHLQNRLTKLQKKTRLTSTELQETQSLPTLIESQKIQLSIFNENSDYYSKMTECGKLHIYDDGTGRSMRFEKSKIT